MSLVQKRTANPFHTILLYLIHFLYFLYTTITSFVRTRQIALPPRTWASEKLPPHVSLLLIQSPTCSENENRKAFLESVRNVTKWCLDAGIEKCSVFDRHDYLAECSKSLNPSSPSSSSPPTPPLVSLEENERQTNVSSTSWHRTTLTLPLTPPPSDHSISRPRSPQEDEEDCSYSAVTLHITQDSELLDGQFFPTLSSDTEKKSLTAAKPLTLYIATPSHSKTALVSAARTFVKSHQEQISLSLSTLHHMLETSHGFPSPDLLIVHHLSGKGRKEGLRLWGYPPWQSHLTEIHQTNSLKPSLWSFFQLQSWSRRTQTKAHPMTLDAFVSALDEFSTAQMRNGK